MMEAACILKITISRIILIFFVFLVQTVLCAKRMWSLKYCWRHSAGIIIVMYFVHKCWCFVSVILFCFWQAFIASTECSLFCFIIFCTLALPLKAILYYTILYYTILYYTVVYCIIIYCNILKYTIPYCTILYCTILYCTILYYTILYCTVLYYTSVPSADL